MKLRERFKELALKGVSEYIDALAMAKCCAEYWGKIGSHEIRSRKTVSECKNKCVLMILESPHIREYVVENGKFQFRGIAIGRTGNLISKYADDVFEDLKGYSLYLINAIDFQCSLGMCLSLSSRFVKDKVVATLSESNLFEASLRTRLMRLMSNVNSGIIVNASGEQCNGEVMRVLKRCCFSKLKCAGPVPHPSSWYRSECRKKSKEEVSKALNGG